MVDVAAMVNVEDLDDMGLVVDSVDDAVGSAARAVTACQRAEERLTYPAWPQGKRSIAELENGCRH